MRVTFIIISSFARRKGCRVIVPFRTVVKLVLKVVLATSLDRALIVRVKANPHPRFTPDTSTNLSVSTGANRAAVGKEEVQELVWDSKV